MTLEDYRKDYYAYSSKTSDIARQLAFAGLALVWVFKVQKFGGAIGELVVPPGLLPPALLFCAALTLDLLHAITGTLIWGSFASYHERRNVQDDDDVDAPSYLNWPTLVLFWAKVACVVFAYLGALSYIYALM